MSCLSCALRLFNGFGNDNRKVYSTETIMHCWLPWKKRLYDGGEKFLVPCISPPLFPSSLLFREH